RALAIDEASLGPDHPDVAGHLNSLGELLRKDSRLAEAEPLSRRALAITETSFGPDHPNVAIHLNNLALLLQAANRRAQAQPPSARHVAIFISFEHKTGHPHPHRDAALHNYAGLLEAMGQSEAEIRTAIAGVTAGGV